MEEMTRTIHSKKRTNTLYVYGACILLIGGAALIRVLRLREGGDSDPRRRGGTVLVDSAEANGGRSPTEHQYTPQLHHRRSDDDSMKRADPDIISPLVFDDDGEISRQLLLLAGIDESERSDLESIVAESRWNIAKAMSEVAVIEGRQTNKSSISETYLIRSQPENAAELKRSLQFALRQRFGKGAARILMPYLTSDAFYGGYGMRDVRITATIELVEGRQVYQKSVRCQVYDASGGRQVGEYEFAGKGCYDVNFGGVLEKQIASGDWSDAKWTGDR